MRKNNDVIRRKIKGNYMLCDGKYLLAIDHIDKSYDKFSTF